MSPRRNQCNACMHFNDNYERKDYYYLYDFVLDYMKVILNKKLFSTIFVVI